MPSRRSPLFATLAAFAALAAPAVASAQTAVVVDRDAMTGRLRDWRHQLEVLQQQISSLRAPPNSAQAGAIGQINYNLGQLQQQVRDLEKDLRSLPPAGAVAQAPPPPPQYAPPAYPPGRPGPTTVMPPPPAYPTPPPPAYPVPPPPPHHGPGHHVVDDATFSSIVAAVNEQSFAQDKLRVVGDAARTHLFRVEQVIQLLNALDFPTNKVSALEMLAPRMVDRGNDFKIYGAFTFSSDKEKARKILERTPPPERAGY